MPSIECYKYVNLVFLSTFNLTLQIIFLVSLPAVPKSIRGKQEISYFVEFTSQSGTVLCIGMGSINVIFDFKPSSKKKVLNAKF